MTGYTEGTSGQSQGNRCTQGVLEIQMEYPKGGGSFREYFTATSGFTNMEAMSYIVLNIMVGAVARVLIVDICEPKLSNQDTYYAEMDRGLYLHANKVRI